MPQPGSFCMPSIPIFLASNKHHSILHSKQALPFCPMFSAICSVCEDRLRTATMQHWSLVRGICFCCTQLKSVRSKLQVQIGRYSMHPRSTCAGQCCLCMAARNAWCPPGHPWISQDPWAVQFILSSFSRSACCLGHYKAS